MKFNSDSISRFIFIQLFLMYAHLFAAIDLTGIGTRAQSMGGNFRSIADDYSAMFWNPAGLAFQNGSHLGFSMTLVKQTSSFLAESSPLYLKRIEQGEGSESVSGLKQFSATYPYTVKSSTPLVAVPSIGFYQCHDQWAWGIGAWAAFGIRASFDLIGTSHYNQITDSFPGEDWKDDMKFIDIHPTIAYRISEKLSVGAGFSLVIADIYLQKPAFSSMNPYITNISVDSLYRNYIQTYPESEQEQLLRALKDIKSSPKDHIVADTYLSGTGLGIGGNLGIMIKPAETFSIGASIQYYADIPIDGDATVFAYYPYQEDIEALSHDEAVVHGKSYQGLLDYYRKQGIELMDYIPLSNFGTGLIDTLRENEKVHADMSLPIRMGIGLSYTGIDHLTIAADVGFSTWSAWDVFHIYSEDGVMVSGIEKNWKDVIRFGMGMEYAASLFKLRSGFYTESRAAIDATMVPTNPDVSRRNVISAGVELPLGKYRFHFCYEHTLMSDLDIKTWVPFENNFDYKNMAGHYSASMQNFMIGIDMDI